MNGLIGNLLSSGLGSGLLEQMAGKSGLDVGSIGNVVSKVAPALMEKANENFKGDKDSSNLLDLIDKTNLDDLTKDPGKLADTEHGNAILGELTGSKEESRALASDMGNSLGVDAGSITKILPMVAPLVAGMLNKQKSALGSGGDTNMLTSALSSFIDKDNDGSVADDLMGMAGKFFK